MKKPSVQKPTLDFFRCVNSNSLVRDTIRLMFFQLLPPGVILVWLHQSLKISVRGGLLSKIFGGYFCEKKPPGIGSWIHVINDGWARNPQKIMGRCRRRLSLFWILHQDFFWLFDAVKSNLGLSAKVPLLPLWGYCSKRHDFHKSQVFSKESLSPLTWRWISGWMMTSS